MGKVIGIGGGFGGDENIKLVKYIISLSGKKYPNYLQIPTTCYDSQETGSISVFAKMGCQTDVLYLTHAYINEEIIASKINNADVIYVPGGNLKFLSDVWKRTNCMKYLKQAFEDGKVLFGTSSGSMCWFNEGFDDCGPEDSFMFVDALGLLPYCNCPHYESAFWQNFNEHIPTRKLSGIACENESAICYIDGKWSTLISGNRPDARVWFFDKDDNFKRYDLTQHPEILERL